MKYVALIRALGFPNTIPMKDLGRIVERCGGHNARTYIASGNVVFEASRLDVARFGARVSAGIKKARGFAPDLVVLTRAQLQRAIAANPFPQADAAPNALHLVFLMARPKAPDYGPLERVLKAGERHALKGRVFYFYAPDGAGRSDAFRRIERTVGKGTARNWRTCRTLLDMADGKA